MGTWEIGLFPVPGGYAEQRSNGCIQCGKAAIGPMQRNSSKTASDQKHLKIDKVPSCHRKLHSPFKTTSQLAFCLLGFFRRNWSFPDLPDPEDHLGFTYPAESYLQEVLIKVIGQIQWLLSVRKKRRGCREAQGKLGLETRMLLSQTVLEVLA